MPIMSAISRCNSALLYLYHLSLSAVSVILDGSENLKLNFSDSNKWCGASRGKLWINIGENLMLPDMFCTIKYECLPKLWNTRHFSSFGTRFASYAPKKSVMIG